MTGPAKVQVPYFITQASVEVEIDPDDLHADGWHHEKECSHGAGLAPENPAVEGALENLHQQAHPDEPLNLAHCRAEPCRSLSIAETQAAAKVAAFDRRWAS